MTEKKGGKSKPSEESTIRKTKSFKRIRGLLKGVKNLGKTKTPKPPPKKESAKPENRTGDADTLYDVDVEDRSVVSRSTVEDDTKPYLLKIVLLLMDPETRRFELLQLEFDSHKATVHDVLAQISVSVTEDALRQQTYVAICGPEGKEMPPYQKLSTFCRGNEVLVAIPTGMEASECVRLANPILMDEKVGQMLISSGIHAEEWKGDGAKKDVVKDTPVAPLTPKKKKKKAAKSSGILIPVFLTVLTGVLLQVFHLYISAPIQRGNIVAPDIWLRQCGLDFFTCSENNYFRVHDGKAIFSDDKHDVLWIIEGSTCKAGDEDCQPGMQVRLDGSIAIGNSHVQSVTMYDEKASLTPWPFAEEPKLKIRRSKKPLKQMNG